jgi:hypothetical protein
MKHYLLITADLEALFWVQFETYDQKWMVILSKCFIPIFIQFDVGVDSVH